MSENNDMTELPAEELPEEELPKDDPPKEEKSEIPERNYTYQSKDIKEDEYNEIWSDEQ